MTRSPGRHSRPGTPGPDAAVVMIPVVTIPVVTTRSAPAVVVAVRPTGLEPFWPSRRAPAYSEFCR